MKNAFAYILLAVLLVVFWVEFHKEKNYLEKIDSLTDEIFVLKAEAEGAYREMEFYQAKAMALGNELADEQKLTADLKANHHRLIKQLRSQPPVEVVTTNIRMAECDSCMEVGAQIVRENELQKMQLIQMDSALFNCQRGYTNLDTALKVGEARFAICEKQAEALTAENSKLKVVTGFALALAVLGIVF